MGVSLFAFLAPFLLALQFGVFCTLWMVYNTSEQILLDIWKIAGLPAGSSSPALVYTEDCTCTKDPHGKD